MSTYADALSRLKAVQKTSAGVSLYSRFINRPVGRRLAAAAFAAGLSPNGVTVLSAVVTVAGLALLVAAPPSLPVAVGVAVALMLGFALDSADGQVARLSGRSSLAGEWLDHVVDAGKMVAVHAAVLVAIVRFTDWPLAWATVPLIFQLVAILTYAGGTLHALLRGKRSATVASPSTLRSIGLLPADYGILAMAFVLWFWPPLFMAAYSILLLLNLAIMTLLLRKWFRTLETPEPRS